MKKVLVGLFISTALLIAGKGLIAQQTLPANVTVVAKESFVGVSSDIPTTVLKTPTNDGDYEVTIYAIFFNSNANSSIRFTTDWTDELGSEENLTSIGPGGNSANPNSTVVLMHVVGGQPISVTGTLSPGTITSTYNIYVTLVKL